MVGKWTFSEGLELDIKQLLQAKASRLVFDFLYYFYEKKRREKKGSK